MDRKILFYAVIILNLLCGPQVYAGGGTSGSFSSGQLQHLDASPRLIDVKDYGAKGDGTTDDTAAIQAALNTSGRTITAYFPAGTYKISSTIYAIGPIKGDSPTTTIIYNTSTGDALDVSGAYYHTHFSDFAVEGNSNSRDGITTYVSSGNVAYSEFENVYSYGNGRHGFYLKYIWGTSFLNCKAGIDGNGNGGLGFFLDGGASGVSNGVTFFNCEARDNGGSSTSVTYASNNGGVKVVGAADVNFIGGVYEANNGWQFIINGSSYTTRNVHIRNIYSESFPAATVGGFLYAASNWTNVTVDDSWINISPTVGNTEYIFYFDTAGNFRESGNFTYTAGSGTSHTYGGTGSALAVLPSQTGYYYLNGNVGIGTASPAQAMTIDVGAGNNGGMRIQDGSGLIGLLGTGGFVNGGSVSDMGINSYGNLVIGTGSSGTQALKITSGQSILIANASSHAGYTTCFTTNGQIGYCSSVVASGGTCTCNGI